MDSSPEICSALQESFRSLALGDKPRARKYCLQAAKLNGNLKNALPAALQLAKFTVEQFEIGELPIAKKLQWLLSHVRLSFWPPIIQFSQSLSSLDIPPLQPPPTSLDTPDLGSEFTISPELRDISASSTNGLVDLYQDLLPNCSFVLSILAIIDLGLQDLLVGAVRVFPDQQAAKVKLHLNGCAREVSVSTVLPFISKPHQNRSLIIRSHSNPDLLWPALIEKAYLMAVGQSYRFSGSNMAQDMYTLLAWPPEVRQTSKMSLDAFGELWELRKEKKVSLGLGTGQASASLARKLGVVPEHDYLVCGYDGLFLQLKNPWSNEDSDRFLDVDAAMFAQFTYVYINWNPAKFPHSTSTPVIYAPPQTSPLVLIENPQFELKSETSQEIRICIEQNISKDDSPCFVSVYELSGPDLVVHSMQYPRVFHGKVSPKNTLLATVQLEAGKFYNVVITGSPKRELLSLKTYSDAEVLVKKPKNVCPHVLPPVHDQWNFGYNGGSWIEELYIDNPQWDMVVGNSVKNINLVVTCPEDPGISFHVFNWEKQNMGQKIRNFEKSVLVHCENYTKFLHDLSMHQVNPGVYRIVVSCYDSSFKGDFQLLCMHDGEKDSVSLEKVPHTMGLYCAKVNFDWNLSNRRKYALWARKPQTKVTFHIRQGEPRSQDVSGYRPAVRASLFDGVSKNPVVVNEKWNDCVYGVFVDCVIPEKDHQYILLVERFDTGSGLCRLDAWSSQKLDLEDIPN